MSMKMNAAFASLSERTQVPHCVPSGSCRLNLHPAGYFVVLKKEKLDAATVSIDYCHCLFMTHHPSALIAAIWCSSGELQFFA